ncbi:SRPBCC family protein [Streptomyces sp. NBC_00249]|uniref:SRPBCC family protein n=1 Tax=Streptomyces sp. NBC_00249 TaxID=2975690 RepID=UPI0022542988|nr:SRPBCC family protein [Streptomyces sp. NBC_00249]MCX5192710.1 SRPBCC family protein [Streptomyces sp. NBC_00249]
MWDYEHSVETTATPGAIWRLWADVENWADWNAEIEKIEIDGPFAPGTRITMTPPGDDPVELTLAEVREDALFVDEARFGDLLLRTSHRIDALGPELTRVTYRMEISGAGSDQAGPEIGPAITADWPDTMAALAKLAAR